MPQMYCAVRQPVIYGCNYTTFNPITPVQTATGIEKGKHPDVLGTLLYDGERRKKASRPCKILEDTQSLTKMYK